MSFRHALQHYLDNDEDPAVRFHDDTVVIIEDQYPKSLRHWLVMPRSKQETHKHPFEAFKNAKFFHDIEEYVEKAKQMMVDSLVPDFVDDNVPAKAEFKQKFIRAGIHSEPSMANLHIHIITQDFCLPRMKNKKHYNSFTTSFFVDFDDLRPARKSQYLEDEGSCESDQSDGSDEGIVIRRNQPFLGRKRTPDRHIRDPKILSKIIRDTSLRCVYCGKDFGNKFQELKKHLDFEFRRKFSGK